MRAGSDIRHRRGLDLLAAHSASLELDSATARERLDATLGHELARKLVFALCAPGRFRLGRGTTY